MIGVAFLLSACPALPQPDPAVSQRDPLVPDKVYEPTAVGVVEAEERLGGNLVLITLDDGRQLQIDLNEAARVGNYPQPEPGYLLLYGEDDAGPWYVAVSGNPSCFGIGARAIDHGDALIFNFGLRVPKADNYDPGSVSGTRYDNPRAGFCLNGDGEVTEYQW